MDWIKIEYYEITTFAKPNLEMLPEAARDLARITFYAENRCVGGAHFFPDGEETPDCKVEYVRNDKERPVITLYYPQSMLATVINVLQNEKPLWLFFGNKINAGLTSGKESVGEQEGGAYAAQEAQRRRR